MFPRSCRLDLWDDGETCIWEAEEGGEHQAISLLVLCAQFLMALVRAGNGTLSTPARSGLLNWRTFYMAKEESSMKGCSYAQSERQGCLVFPLCILCSL